MIEHPLLEESIKQQATIGGRASIESDDELGQVKLEQMVADHAMVRAE